jgi:formate hydrogenlyase transcriptional activator
MDVLVAPSTAALWLLKNGPKQLEELFRAILYKPSVPLLVVDSVGNSVDASVGAARLFGIPREKIIGRKLDGELEALVPVELLRTPSVLPERDVVLLKDPAAASSDTSLSSSVQDYALYLMDRSGTIVTWYAGAERMYGYRPDEAIGQHISLLYPADNMVRAQLNEKLNRAAVEGHIGTEAWRMRKDGSRFWANAITMAIKDESGQVCGFGRVVRDFTDRHERDEKLRRTQARIRPASTHSTISGVVSGEFDQIPEMNDAFLEMIGYTNDDVATRQLHWSELTPPEYAALDDIAHEEGLRFGACTPYKKELIRKDGTRLPVLVSTAVLKLTPFRWISFVQDLTDVERFETIEPADADADPQQDFAEMVGGSPGLRRVQKNVEVVAPTDATVLILGETGTGKELIARAIHQMSPRRNMPFITLNCAAIPTGLLESELFGYERGAFTGALQQKIGRFEMAHKGTLFLDEVGDIPIDLQPKLLRALQEKSFERLGGTKTIPIDVRLVAATNRNLTQMMGDKLFRSDLYYRLKVFPITTPPLRDRPEDIAILAKHFTTKYADKMGRQIDKIPVDVLKALTEWRWPGNVRELENFIERSVILSTGSSLRAPIAEIRDDASTAGSSDGAVENLEQVEREHILKILRESNGVVSAAATRLGLHRTTLNAMMKKLGITRDDF